MGPPSLVLLPPPPPLTWLTTPPSATEVLSLMLVTLPHTMEQPMWLPTPQFTTPSTLPQLLPTPSTPPQLTRPRPTPMRFLPTPSPTLLPMTTPRLTSTLRSNLMAPAMLPDLTLLLFPMDVSNMSSILPMVMMDMSPMSHTRELLSTQRPSLMPLPQPQPTMPKP